MTNTDIQADIITDLEWHNIKIIFGQIIKGYSYYELAHGLDEKFVLL